MPNSPKEFEPIDFTARIARQRRKNRAILKGPTRSSDREERARAEASERALDRVEKRLSKQKRKKKKSGGSKDRAAARRAVVEKATGTDEIINPLRAIGKKMKANKRE